MTTAAEWKDLARRAREATGPDREIDLTLARTIDAVVKRQETGCAPWEYTYWHFTRLIDDAVALIEKTLPGHDRIFSKIDGKFSAEIGPEGTFYTVAGSGASEALALVAAYCDSRAAIEEGDGE